MVLPLSLGAAGLLIVADPTPARPAPPRRLDWIGLGAFGAALLSATYVLTQGSRWDWLEASRIGWMSAIAIAALLLSSAEHTAELQSLMRISYAVFCLKK